MVERNLQQNQLYGNHDECLYEQRHIELRAGIVEHSANRSVMSSLSGNAANLMTEATSIISGISNENPALDFVRCIEYV